MKQAQNLIIYVAGIAGGEANFRARSAANVLSKPDRDRELRAYYIFCPIALTMNGRPSGKES
jgi:hypothetical protein